MTTASPLRTSDFPFFSGVKTWGFLKFGTPKNQWMKWFQFFICQLSADFWAVQWTWPRMNQLAMVGGVDFPLLGHVCLFSGTFLRVENHHIFDGKNNYNGPFYGDDQWETKKLLLGALEHLDYFSVQLGMSSSQLTKSIIFQRGRYTAKQFFVPCSQ